MGREQGAVDRLAVRSRQAAGGSEQPNDASVRRPKSNVERLLNDYQ